MSDAPQVGDRITFADEKRAYIVQAVSGEGRWLVCTKPFPPKSTVIYTVVDTVEKLRGTDNYRGLGYETRDECERACAMFETGEAEFSHRRPPIAYEITRVRATAERDSATQLSEGTNP